MISIGDLWNKGISIRTGQAPEKKCQALLRDMIITGRAKPSFVVSQRLPLDDAPEAYRQFGERGGWTKVILKPGMRKAA